MHFEEDRSPKNVVYDSLTPPVGAGRTFARLKCRIT